MFIDGLDTVSVLLKCEKIEVTRLHAERGDTRSNGMFLVLQILTRIPLTRERAERTNFVHLRLIGMFPI